MIGAPVDALAWQRALATRPAIAVTEFYATRNTVTITVRQAVSSYAIPVTMVATVSLRWHDVFEFTIEPHPIKAGEVSMARAVEILTEHATRLAFRASVDRMRARKGRP